MTNDEAGSTLLLVPSALLVLFLLTALAVDSAATFLAQRQLADVCSGAANDAATAALDPGQLFGNGGDPVPVDFDRAFAVVRSRSVPLETQWRHPIAAIVQIEGPAVVVRLDARSPLPIGAGGGRKSVEISATCRASTQRR